VTPQLRALAHRQGGVFTRRQAVMSGCSEREIKTRTGPRGDWKVVRRGAYAERDLWETVDEDERYRMTVRGALLMSTEPAVLSHTSAGAFLGLQLRPHWRRVVHVTRPGVTGGRLEGGVNHHTAAYTVDDVLQLDGLPILGLGRTAVDIARTYGLEDGVVAADAALRLGATRAELARVLAGMPSWPRITTARTAVDLADGGAANIGETLLRLLVLELELGVPETQFHVVEGGREAWVDLRLRRHFIEFDGRVKYVGRESGGVADRSPEQVVWDEKRREDWLRGHDGGHGMSRVIWSDLFGAARAATKRRLRHDILESDRRYGPLG
jgi:hypothetical protein